MSNQIFEKLKKENLVNLVLIILGLFLVSLIISTIVDVQEKLTEAKNTISVTATGEIYAKPDLAQISFSVITEGKTVAEAMTENSQKMNEVIAFIKDQGVEGKDIKTASFYIYPRYEWRKVGEIYPPEGERVLVGYEVNQSLEVKIRDMGKIGEIIQGAAEKGANQVGSLQFTVDNQDELKKQARAQAIGKAKEKAKELSSQLGINLIRISNFQESTVFPRYFEMAEAISAPTGKGGEAPQIETGENKIEVTITITYDIN